jgi:hypothetical protein
MANTCKLINFGVSYKDVSLDCVDAEQSRSFKEIIKEKYDTFNAVKEDKGDSIKRIKTVKLHPGKMLGGEN